MATIRISPVAKLFTASGGTQTFTVIPSDSSLTVTNISIEFLTSERLAYDANDNTFTVTAPENATVQVRSVPLRCTATLSDNSTASAIVEVRIGATQFYIAQTDYSVGFTNTTLNVTTTTSSDNIDDLQVVIPAEATWIHYTGHNYVNNQEVITFSVDTNDTDSSRNANIQISVIKNGEALISQLINVFQSVEADIAPIWQDYVWTEDTLNTFVEYHLNYGVETVFAGKAYKMPNSNDVSFLLNSVSENYLNNNISFAEGVNVMTDYLKSFNLVTSEGADKPILFFNDWSYKNRDLSKATILNDPITGIVDNRQYLMFNWLLPVESADVNLTINDTETDLFLNNGINGYSYVKNLNDTIYECGTDLVFNVDDSSIKYTIDNTEKDYVLYYVNASGGWDSLLIEGNSKQTDSIESLNYRKRTLNTSLEFDNTKYLNIITPTWTLYTDYLTDEQAAKMFNLLESTCVYLHNLKDNVIIPVIITDNVCEYKTYTNQGKNKFYYTISVEASKNKYRK